MNNPRSNRSKFLKLIAISAFAVCGAQSTLAQSVYGEVGYALMSTKLSVPLIGLSATAEPTMGRALIGISPFGGLSIEAIASGSLSDDNFISKGTATTTLGRAKVNQILGLYVGSRLGLGPVEVYGRAGMAKSEVSFSGLGANNETDFSYGGGLRLIPAGNFTLSADYMNYLNKGGARVEGYTLSVGYKF